MDAKAKAGNLLPMTVMQGVTVNVLPNEAHEFLLTTREVANGYGVTLYNIRQHKLQHPEELISGKHFIEGVSIPNAPANTPHNQVFWTKRGVVRLGFFIKSERAKLFRDWAEELVINLADGAVENLNVRNVLPTKRAYNGNRLTQERLIAILADVCRISDDDLRISITDKLMGGK